MELLWSTRSRGRQPLGWPKVKASWIARGLAFASTLADPRVPNAVTGRISLLAGTRPGPGAFGIARYIGAASTDIIDTSFTGSGRPGGWRTIVVRGMQTTSGGGTFGRILDKEGEFAVYTTGTTLRYTQVFDGVTGIWDVPYTATGKPFTLMITHDRSVDTNVPIMMVDGVALTVTTFTAASGTRVLSSNRMQIGNRASDSARNWDGWLSDVLIIDGPLGGHEPRSLSRDPWQVFEDELRPAFYTATPPPGAAIASHTIAAFAQTATVKPIARASATHSIPAFGRSASASLAEYVVWDNYERSSVNVALSTITGGAGDAALITLAPRLQESEVVSGTRWLEPSARVTGVNGKRPTFRFSGYNVTQGDGTQHGAWDSTRRPKFSYDRVTWYDFDTQTIGSTYIEFRHNTTFTSDTVYISRSRQMSVEQTGAWLASLASTYPTLIGPAPSAVAYTPSGSVSGFSGQSFIADEFSAQTDELGRTIPVTPYYAAMIEDVAQVPTLVNLLTYTEDFSNTIWNNAASGLAAVTLAAGTAPNGTNTANKLAELATTDVHRRGFNLSAIAGVPRRFSFYAKAAERTVVQGWAWTGVTHSAVFDLANGVCVGTGLNPRIASAGNGWYRCSFDVPASNNSSVVIALADSYPSANQYYLGTAGSGAYFWGAQLEYGSTETPYQPVMPVANLLTFPEAFDNAAWQKVFSSVSANAVAAPDGSRTADKLVEDTANNQHTVRFFPTFVTATSYTLSVYAKAAERSIVGLVFPNGFFSGWIGASFDLAAGVVGFVSSGVSASIVAAGNGWYRCTVTATSTAGGAGSYVTIKPAVNSAVDINIHGYQGDGVSGLYLWGAKLEAAASATPYRTKRLAVLASGVHAGEDHANYVHKAVVERLLGSSAEAIQIRKNYRIAVPPLINAVARAGGGWRGSFTQGVSGEDDANRHFNETGTGLQIIDKPKAALTIDRAGSLVAWAIDVHGSYGSTWASFEDAGVPASIAFRSRLATESGFTIADEGDSHAGFLSEYLRGFGAAFAVTVETGDPSPVSDAEIATFAKAVVRTISGMAVNILSSATQTVPGFTQVATARPRVAGTASQTVAAFTQAVAARPRVKATTAQAIAAFTHAATVVHVAPRLATATQIIPAFGQAATVVHGAVAHATATQVVAAFTSAAAAKPRVKATSAQSLQPFSQAANATIRFTSTAGASQSVPAFTSAGTAKARAAASAARIIAAFQVNATAAVRARATATQAIQAFAQSASIGEIPPRTASAAQQVPAFLAAQVAMVRLRLQGSQTITPFPQTATARDPAAAPTAAYLPATITAVLSVKEFEVRLG